MATRPRQGDRYDRAWIKEQRVDVKDGRIVEYQVNLLVTFILHD